MKKIISLFVMVCVFCMSVTVAFATSNQRITFDNSKISFNIDIITWDEDEAETIEGGVQRFWSSYDAYFAVSEMDVYDIFDEGDNYDRSSYNYSSLIEPCSDEEIEEFVNTVMVEEGLTIKSTNLSKKGKVNYIACSGNLTMSGVTMPLTAYITINNGYLFIAEFINASDEDITEIIGSSQYTDLSWEHPTGFMIVLDIILGIILTAVMYMAYPFVRTRFMKVKYDEKSCKKMAAINSVVVGIVFFSITVFLTDLAKWSAGPAFFYYFLNSFLWVSKSADDKEVGLESAELVAEDDNTEETLVDEIDTQSEATDCELQTNTIDDDINVVTIDEIPYQEGQEGMEDNTCDIESENIDLIEVEESVSDSLGVMPPSDFPSDSSEPESAVSIEIPVEELQLLKKLYDEGILTEAEFKEKKKLLLGI